MELEIRDTQSSAALTIPAAGLTFGREGSSADHTVPDRTVSSKHAKIFAREGKWFIEDLQSSNGTFVNGERISSPVQLTVGDRFSLCRYGFEVAGLVGESAAAGELHASTAVLGDAVMTDGASGVSDATDVAALQAAFRDEHGSAAENRPGATGYTPEGDLEPLPREPTAPSQVRVTAAVEGGSPFAYFLATVPKAAAYYLAAVPQLLFNPLGFVRKGIANQRFGAFGPRELIAYALPAFIVAAAVGMVSTTIYQLAWGHIGAGLFISPLIVLAVLAVVAVVTGFIWHPVVRWFVRLLRGESTAESRSNCFVMVYTGYILTAIPAAVATFAGLVPEPLFGAVPLVLTLAANLILTLIAYSWFTFFRVVKWFPIVLLVLGGLSCVMTAKTLIDMVRARVSGAPMVAGAAPGAGGDASAADGGDVAAVQARIAALNAELQAGGLSPEEVRAKAAELQELKMAATQATQAAATGAAAGGEAADEDSESVEATNNRAEGAKTAAAGSEARDSGGEAAGPAADGDRLSAAAVGPETPYEEFQRKRQAVENALDKDPTLLKRKGVESLYKELHKISYKVKQKHKVKMGKRVTAEKIAQQKVAEKLRDAEIYEQCSGLVDRLYKRVVER